MGYVYDLSVPGPHEYVAHGLMSHNTMLGISRIIRLKQQGKRGVAIVICPGILVKEWCSEINRMSQGQINGIPITTITVRKMIDHLQFDRKQFIKYVQTSPENTIFVVDMRFLSNMNDIFQDQTNTKGYVKYGSIRVQQFPQVQLVRQLNPVFVNIDESQRIKNDTSQIAKASRQVITSAPIRAIGSGTLVSNIASDIVNQYSVFNPTMLGTVEDFNDNFSVIDEKGRKLGPRRDAGQLIANIVRPYIAVVHKTSADWAFVMPQINEQFYEVLMTSNQQKFYNSILAKAIEDIKKDPKLAKLMKEGDEKNQKEIEKALKRHLNPVEIFVNAPDANEAFRNLENNRPEDLVAAKVKKAIQLLRAHFGGGVVDDIKFVKETSKVVIFCYNKAVSLHFYKYLKEEFPCLHFAAGVGSEEVLLSFKQDPKYTVLIADETALKEGLNLQVASRVIRVQTLWTPGAQTQAVARVMRPDILNKFNRKEINYDWLVAMRTMEVAKVARLISKIIQNNDVQEGNNTEYQKFIQLSGIPDLPIIKMNFDFINQFQNPRDDSISNYYDAYSKLREWEVNQTFIKIDQLKMRVAKKLGIQDYRKVTMDQLRTEAMVPVTPAAQLAGSKSIFVPMVNGTEPVDFRGLKLKPLALLKKAKDNEDDDGDDDENDNEGEEEIEDAETVASGDLVQTEYGFGEVITVLKTSVRVFIPGFTDGKGVTLNKTIVFKPTDELALAKLQKDYKAAGKKGITFLNGLPLNTIKGTNVLPVKKVDLAPPVAPVVDNETPDVEEPEYTTRSPKLPTTPKEDKGIRVSIESSMVNGFPMIYLMDDDQKAVEAVNDSGLTWKQIPAFGYMEIKNINGAKTMVNELRTLFPNITTPTTDQIMNMAKLVTTRGNSAIRQGKPANFSDMRNFFKLNHQAPNPGNIRITPVVWDGGLFVIAVMQLQPKAIAKFRKIRGSGIGPFSEHDSIHAHLASSLKGAIQAVNEIKAKFKTRGANDALSYFNGDAKKLIHKAI